MINPTPCIPEPTAFGAFPPNGYGLQPVDLDDRDEIEAELNDPELDEAGEVDGIDGDAEDNDLDDDDDEDAVDDDAVEELDPDGLGASIPDLDDEGDDDEDDDDDEAA